MMACTLPDMTRFQWGSKLIMTANDRDILTSNPQMERAMASPFPGMDPYLEGEMWQEFHTRLANQISAQLMPLLPRSYVALLAKRYVLDSPGVGLFAPSERIFYPDVHVAHVHEAAVAGYGGQSRLAEPAVEIPSLEEVPVLTVEIRDIAERRLVTAIDILSPVNKRGDGYREYMQRRTDLFRSRVHLLELDLLRLGTRIQLLREPPPATYYVYLSRGDRRPLTQVWPIGLRETLPVVPVPLLEPDPDVPLDLQAAVIACFELVGYGRLLDYASPLPPPLTDEEAAWVKGRVEGWACETAATSR